MNFSSTNKLGTAVFPYALLPNTISIVCLALASICFSTAAPAHAQQRSALSAIYGRGVHAYFAGNMSQAEEFFNQAIQAGSTDPRPYYYRAMVRLGQGRTFEAENDMRVGASHEARNPGVHSSIGRSLQRLQGPGRRTLEQFRRQARLDRLQQGQERSQQRYQQLDRRAPNVLRHQASSPLEQPVQPPQGMIVQPEYSVPMTMPPSTQSHIIDTLPTVITNTPPPAYTPAPVQPMPEGSATREGSGTRSSADDPFGVPAPITPAYDPFGDAPAPGPAPMAEPATPAPFTPAPGPAEADPFGGELPTPAAQPQTPLPSEEMPQPQPAAEDDFGDDAFGDAFGDEPAEEDAFSDAPVEEEAEAPMEEEPQVPAESADPDPFGESTEDAPMEEAPTEEAPAEEDSSEFSDDPFGDESAPADESDPFGDEPMESEESAPADDSPADDAPPEEAPPEEEGQEPEADEDDPFGDF